MIDIHAHILPGVDDGAADLDTTLAMCAMAAKDGTTIMVATPHEGMGNWRTPRRDVLSKVATLNKTIDQSGIPLKILPGADVLLTSDTTDRLSTGELTTVADTGSFMLIELPAVFAPEFIRRQVFALKIKGVTPIITHPERNELAMHTQGLMENLVRSGALIQVTAGAFTGSFGRRVRSNAISLLLRRMAHVVASDCHDTETRPPGLSDACAVIAEHMGEDEARAMSHARPLDIINGRMPLIDEPLPERPGFFSRLLFRRGR
jgi:protein-tyrosine phosphatase